MCKPEDTTGGENAQARSHTRQVMQGSLNIGSNSGIAMPGDDPHCAIRKTLAMPGLVRTAAEDMEVVDKLRSAVPIYDSAELSVGTRSKRDSAIKVGLST